MHSSARPPTRTDKTEPLLDILHEAPPSCCIGLNKRRAHVRRPFDIVVGCWKRVKQLMTRRLATPAAGPALPPPSAELVSRLYSALECSICMERFHPFSPGTPRQLRCGHTFCERCLNTMMLRIPAAGKAGKAVACPSCREETVVPKGNATTLQRDLTLMSLLLE